MEIVDSFATRPTFDVLEPAVNDVPFVFSVPHSGTIYPRDLLRCTKLDWLTLRRSEDTFVDELFSGVVDFGAPAIRAKFPRVYLDLNREENELDPTMFDGPLCVPVNADSPRVAGGLGVIAKIVGERQEIYRVTLPPSEAEFRIERFWRPYHEVVAGRLDRAVRRFGTAVLVDCHSMPSGAVKTDDRNGSRADIILGDRFGTSCMPKLTDELTRLLRRRGFVVGRNRPYAGGYITERYGRPPTVHAIQLELSRSLYMDEAAFTRLPRFSEIRRELTEVCGELIAWFAELHIGGSWALAAE